MGTIGAAVRKIMAARAELVSQRGSEMSGWRFKTAAHSSKMLTKRSRAWRLARLCSPAREGFAAAHGPCPSGSPSGRQGTALRLQSSIINPRWTWRVTRRLTRAFSREDRQFVTCAKCMVRNHIRTSDTRRQNSKGNAHGRLELFRRAAEWGGARHGSGDS